MRIIIEFEKIDENNYFKDVNLYNIKEIINERT